MDKGTANAFGTVKMNAQVLSDVARPNGSGGQHVPSFPAGDPTKVGQNMPTYGGQKGPASGGEPLFLGQTKPGGVNGQGTGEGKRVGSAGKGIID